MEKLYDTLHSLTFPYRKHHSYHSTPHITTDLSTRIIFIMRLLFVQFKLEMLKKLKDKMQPDDVLKTANLEIQFCGTSTVPKAASSTYLPVMVHRCPDNFSTVEYFEVLIFV